MIDTKTQNQFERVPMNVMIPEPRMDRPLSRAQASNGRNLHRGSVKNHNVMLFSRTYDAIIDIDGGADFKTAEDAITFIKEIGGGDIFIRSGTYKPLASMTINVPCNIEGVNAALVTINFNSTASQFIVNSGTAYATGTITSIVGGTAVTASGTLWLANASAGQYIFLGTRWYLIAAVTGNTTLVLGEAYSDNLTVPGLAYRIATLTRYVSFEQMTIKNSTSTAIAATDCRSIFQQGLVFLTNNKGFVYTNVSEADFNTVTVVASVSNGYEVTNGGFINGSSVSSVGNGTGGTGSGAVFNNVKYGEMTFSACESNATDGYNLTNCTTYYFTVSVRINTIGINLVSVCTEIIMIGCSGRNNTSDGIKMTTSCNYCKVIGGHFDTNGGWGVNEAGTSDKNVIVGNSFNANTSGTVTTVGANTVNTGNTT